MVCFEIVESGFDKLAEVLTADPIVAAGFGVNLGESGQLEQESAQAEVLV